MKKYVSFIAIFVLFVAVLMGQQSFAQEMVERSKIPSRQGMFFSGNHEFYGEVEYSTGNPEYIPIDRFMLKDRSGSTVYEKIDFGHTLVDISNGGEVVGIDFDGPISGAAVLHFYDVQGQELGIKHIGFLRERRFNEKGNLYCVNDGNSGLQVFQPDGNVLYQLGSCNWFAVSSDGRYIAMTTDTELILLEAGLEIERIALHSPFIRHMQFSCDGSLLGYMDNKKLYLYDLENKENAFEYHEMVKNLKLVSFDIAPDNSACIIGLSEDKGSGMPNRHERGFIYLLSMDGDLRWKDEVLFTKWNVHIPKVAFTDDDVFEVFTVDDIYKYQF